MLGDVIAVFEAELWIWDARRADSWTFVSLPAELSQEIRELADGPRRGFGSQRVRVTLGASTWATSVFPDSGRNCYVLPVKRAVRKAEDLNPGDIATLTVELILPPKASEPVAPTNRVAAAPGSFGQTRRQRSRGPR
jgi:hypothetical protein